ncbi:MAG: imidazoleglycerol-phosphate dehydratase HisB [Candidatus Ranarchaeia archaeon]
MNRERTVKRKTKETDIEITINLDGFGNSTIETEYPFLTHMLSIFSKHSLIDLDIKAKGDSVHHLIEDVGITLGKSINDSLGDRKGITRFGSSICPMDECLVTISVDLGGRSFSAFNGFFMNDNIEGFPSEMVQHFIRSLSESIKGNIHVLINYGSNDHHKLEAVFKGLALAIKQAIQKNPRVTGVPSTKGKIGD